MKKNRLTNFLVGLLIGTLGVLLFWYWQKSTSAEDGALDLLDRYAAAQARLQRMESVSPPAPQASSSGSDDLQVIAGIGPTYAGRLQSAGVTTYEQLAAQTPDRVRQIAGMPMSRTADAAEWIGVARLLAES